MQAQHATETLTARSPASTSDRFVRPAGRFALHLAEMCIAMCVGAIALSVVVFEGASLIGFKDLVNTHPLLSAFILAINLSVPMVAWMRFRGMDWRSTLEMSGATMAVGILLIALAWFGIIARASAFEWLRSLACPIMLAVMLLRFNLYSGRAGGHHSHVR